MNDGFTYIITNQNRTVLYIGVTSNIVVRIWQHQQGVYEDSFSKRYNLKHLIYFEYFDSIVDAIDREKELKGWKRNKKMRLILRSNPDLENLYNEDFIKYWSN